MDLPQALIIHRDTIEFFMKINILFYYLKKKYYILTIAKNLIFSERLLLIQNSIRKVRGVGTVRSKDRTLNIKCSIRNTCFFGYVSSVIYTNSPTSGG